MCYRKLLNVISDAIDGFIPQALHVDFELAMINELENAFPSAGIVGCNFHFNQCLYRYIQSDSELYERCRKFVDFELKIKMFSALAFVPLGGCSVLLRYSGKIAFRCAESGSFDGLRELLRENVGWERTESSLNEDRVVELTRRCITRLESDFKRN